MKYRALKKCARKLESPKGTRHLIARLRALEDECSEEEWVNVVANCREAKLITAETPRRRAEELKEDSQSQQ